MNITNSNIRAQPTPPDFSHGSTVLALICLIVTVPVCLTFIVLLIKRRHHYPIAGRGSALLIATSIALFLTSIANACIGLFYHSGTPCSVITLVNYMTTVNVGMLYVLRGWILVFRIEIMNYLAEQQWREEKRMMMVRMKAKSQSSDKQIHMINVLPVEQEQCLHHSDSCDGVHKTTDLSTIPGVWFITHRQYISSRFLACAVFCIITPLHLGYGMLYLHDSDLDQSDTELHQQGLIGQSQSLRNEELFGRLTFWNRPICTASSTKASYVVIAIICTIFPTLTWSAWKIYIDKKRKARRVQERLKMTGEQLISSPPSSSSSSSSPSSSSQQSLSDEMDSVKRELFLGVPIVIFCTALGFLLAIYALSYKFIVYFLIQFLLFYESIIKPVRISYALSRRIRNELHVGTGVGLKNSIQLRSAATKHEQHHLKYYTLEHYLNSTYHNQDSYNLLLSFTQKEHSSENLLFMREVIQWTNAVRRVEEKMKWNLTEATGIKTQNCSVALFTTTNINTINLKRLSKMIEVPIVPVLAPMHTLASTGPTAAAAAVTPTTVVLATKSTTTTTSDLLAEITHLKSWIDTIQRDYLLPSAVYEVNLPETMLKPLIAMCQQIRDWSPLSSAILDDSMGASMIMTNIAGPSSPTRNAALSSTITTTTTTTHTKLNPLSACTSTNAPILLPPPFPLSSLYRQSYAEVYTLIECDSFRRFVLTREFESLLRTADEEETARMEQQPDLVTETAEVAARGVAELARHHRHVSMTSSHLRRPSSVMLTTKLSHDFHDHPLLLPGESQINSPMINPCPCATFQPASSDALTLGE